MEMVIIKRDSDEWNRMWEQVANHPMNEALEDKTLAFNNGEVWQYMGSYRNDKAIIHEFRHRQHPKYDRTEYLKFYGSETISEDDIEKVLAVK
jgi:hypothetical protein